MARISIKRLRVATCLLRNLLFASYQVLFASYQARLYPTGLRFGLLASITLKTT